LEFTELQGRIVSLFTNKDMRSNAILQGLGMDLPRKLACWTKVSDTLIKGLATELRNEQADEGLARPSRKFDSHIFCLLKLLMVGHEQVCLM
jgi:hypothetical protein